MLNRCVIYTRISTSDKGQTTLNQSRELEKIAKLKGLTIVDTFTDEGISGSKGREIRTGFDNLIKGAVRKDFDTILVWDVSRLGRSLQDLVSFLNEIHSVGCDLYIHQSGIDTSTPTGKMMFQFIGIFSEFELSIMKQRIVSGQQRAKSQGKHIGRPTNLNEGLTHSIKYMKTKGVGIRKIARELKVGVNTAYKVLETA